LRVLHELKGSGHSPRFGRIRVEDPHGRAMDLPIEWTDRALPEASYGRPQSAVHAAAPQLLTLARLVEEWGAESQAAAANGATMGDAKHQSCPSEPDAVARPGAGSAATPGRGTGSRAPSGPGRRRRGDDP